MQIKKLTTQNFLGLTALAISFQPGLNLIAGFNGAGKSSLLEAIRFALLGERVRGVRLKSDLPHLISQGAKDGFVSINVDGSVFRRSIKTGECDTATPNLPDAARYVLDSQRFAALDSVARRKFLFELMQVETSHTAVGALLAKAELPEDIVAEVLPMLRSGFEAAERYANEQASQSRGAWKAISGENYGDKKAEGWTPKASDSVTADSGTDDELYALADRVPDLASEAAELLKLLGAAEARARAQSNPELSKRRENLPGWKEKVQVGHTREQELVDSVATLTEKVAAAGGVPCECPHCGGKLLIGQGDVKKSEADADESTQTVADLTAAKADLEATRQGLRKLEGNITLAERLIEEAEVDAGDLDAIREREKQVATDLGRAKLARSSLEIRVREREQAEAKTREALRHHRLVQQWKHCADQLSANGIPATLLAQALHPINAHLAGGASLAEWARVEIHPDMSITYGTRTYTLCSESEQWRADAMIADALARLSGLKVLLLDRLDVLDSPGRSAAVQWLAAIAAEYDTLIVGATLKALPAIEGVNTVWLDDSNTGRKAA